LEHAFNDDDMLALAERFQKGRLSALDAQRIIGAGLRGAGAEIADEAVGRMQAESGAAGFVDIVARLLSATFAGPAAPIVGTIASEIVSGLTEELSAKPKPSGVEPEGLGAAAKRTGTAPLPQAAPSPLRGGVGGGSKPTRAFDSLSDEKEQS